MKFGLYNSNPSLKPETTNEKERRASFTLLLRRSLPCTSATLSLSLYIYIYLPKEKKRLVLVYTCVCREIFFDGALPFGEQTKKKQSHKISTKTKTRTKRTHTREKDDFGKVVHKIFRRSKALLCVSSV